MRARFPVIFILLLLLAAGMFDVRNKKTGIPQIALELPDHTLNESVRVKFCGGTEQYNFAIRETFSAAKKVCELTIYDGNILLVPELANFTRLRTIRYEKVKGLPASAPILKQLPALTEFELDTVGRLDGFPPELWESHITKLKFINASLRTVPPDIGKLTTLEELDLTSNPIQSLPAEIGQTRLSKLTLSRHAAISTPEEQEKIQRLFKKNILIEVVGY